MRWLSRAALGVLLAAWATAGRGDGWSAVIEEQYTKTESTVTDQGAEARTSSVDTVLQRYRLALDKSFFPSLSLAGGGQYEDAKTWQGGIGSADTSYSRLASIFGRLNVGGPTLNGRGSYDRRQEWARTLDVRSPALVLETIAFDSAWRPLDLPLITFRASRQNSFDVDRASQDSRNDAFLLTASYKASKSLLVGYSARYDDNEDRLHGAEQTAVGQTGRVTYEDRWFSRRTLVHLTYDVQSTFANTTVRDIGAEIPTARIPLAGLSLVETFPTPETATLVPNPALVDGNTTAAAGLDIGFSPRTKGDSNAREMGVELPTVPATPVNTIHVWVNQPLPQLVTSAFRFSVYQSDDNERWMPVALVGPVVFGIFENRFELRIEEITARYVKVVTSPLDPAVTIDPKYADIFVTELQFFQTVPAEAIRGRSSSLLNSASASARTVLLQSPNLSHDFSLQVARSDTRTPGRDTAESRLALTNGLSLAHKLAQPLALNARIARQDFFAEETHSGILTYGAGLAYTPLPAMSHAINYSGAWRQGTTGSSLSNALTMFSRAELYRGVSVSGNGGYTLSLLERGQRSTGLIGGATASLRPHRVFQLSGGYRIARNSTSGGGVPASTTTLEQADASASFSPTEALYASASVTRIIRGARPTTLATFGLGWSPLQGGDLTLHATYSKTLDTSAEAVTQLVSPSARWTIRPGTFLDLVYVLSDSSAPAQDAISHLFTANLTVTL
ncbi:hypothetical protein [Anaeromyxobacter sp. SG66]|uniref:hypothetical protein n=1 Tax=Anaeromyxobacter sp. SG66 TaxID=2925410 RepID=UPI001F5A0EF6|nr:hypothetical protein [Anaeromyxobacter sp. SG66]